MDRRRSRPALGEVDGRGLIADLLGARGQWEEQIAQLEVILSIDPTQYEQLQ